MRILPGVLDIPRCCHHMEPRDGGGLSYQDTRIDKLGAGVTDEQLEDGNLAPLVNVYECVAQLAIMLVAAA